MMNLFVVATALVASANAFSPFVADGSSRVGTELHKYSPTKWTPKSGYSTKFSAPTIESSPVLAAPVAPVAPPASSTNVGKSMVNYSVTKWSPQGGANPVFSGPVSVVGAPMETAPVALSSAASAAPVSGKRVNGYSVTKWSPQGGSNPIWSTPAGISSGSSTPDAFAPTSPVATNPIVASASAKKDYSGVKWSPQGGSNPSWGAPVAAASVVAPVAATVDFVTPFAPTDNLAPVPGKVNGHSYSVSKWSPQGGSKPFASAAALHSAVVTAPAVEPTQPVATWAEPVKTSTKGRSYSVSKWSPRGGASPLFALPAFLTSN